MTRILSTLFLVALLAPGLTAQNITKLGQLSYNQSLNDIWGWADTANNKEYALVGLQSQVSVVDVTNPANPQEVFSRSGASSIWRDLKSFQHYAYIVHDVYNGTSDGIMIIDLSTLGNAFPTVYNFKPTINYQGTQVDFKRAHNIYIDEQGILYCFGSNVGKGGALMFDLTQDPANPTYLGIDDAYYYHDGVARGDTLWGAAINKGFFTVVDISNKSNPTVMASQSTPFNFTHNIWFSDDNQRVFTTDERTSAYIASYDVSNLGNITKLDQLRTSFGNNIIPHNTHFLNDFLVTSYYTAGLQIADVSRPGTMVEVGTYDTSPRDGDGFDGAWGAYPYLPSGNILVSDRGEGLYVLSSSYPRACYLEATVTDSMSGQPIPNAQVSVLSANGMAGQTNFNGVFKEGQLDTGQSQVEISAAGYITDTISVNFIRDSLISRQVALINGQSSLPDASAWGHPSLYPNPSPGRLAIQNLPADLKSLHYQLLDVSGKVVAQGQKQVRQQQTSFSWDIPSGVYQLELEAAQLPAWRQEIIIR